MSNSGIDILGYASVIEDLDDVRDAVSTTEQWKVGTNVEYAVYVEFGTSDQAAQPYLRPAARSALRDFDSVVGSVDDADELVEELALRIEEKAKDRAPVDTGNLRRSIEAERL